MGLGDSDEDRWIMRKIICLWGIRGGKIKSQGMHKVYGIRQKVGGWRSFEVFGGFLPYTLHLRP